MRKKWKPLWRRCNLGVFILVFQFLVPFVYSQVVINISYSLNVTRRGGETKMKLCLQKAIVGRFFCPLLMVIFIKQDFRHFLA